MMGLKRGQVPTVDQWAEIKKHGWTVDSWNAEMDARRNANADSGLGLGFWGFMLLCTIVAFLTRWLMQYDLYLPL